MTTNGAEKIHGIFLLFEGLPKTIIESQVIVPVAGLMEHGVEMEIWSFAVTKNAFHHAKTALPDLEKRYPAVKIRVFRGVRPALPFSEYLNAALLAFQLRLLHAAPKFVHARTEHATMIAAIIKKAFGFKLIWDARGDAVSEFIGGILYLPSYLKPFYKLKLRAIKNRLRMARENCDFGFFVSNALRELQAPTLPIEKTLITPCLADDKKFFWSPNLRKTTRARLNISENDVVLIYVGSMAFWQCIPETVALIEKTLACNVHAKAIIVTPDVEKFTLLINEKLIDRVKIRSAKLDEVNAYLNAADYGILLRHRNGINWVASPVKFAEYCLTGLKIVSNDAVRQISEYGTQLENIVTPEKIEELCLTENFSERASLAASSLRLLSMKSTFSKRSEKYKSSKTIISEMG